MTPWLIISLLSLLCIGYLILPFIRPRAEIETDNSAIADIAVYKDQLAEVDRDEERGQVNETEAQAIRLEIKRRILSAADSNDGQPITGTKKPAWISAILIICLPIAAVFAYLELGSPDVHDFPFAQRTDIPDPAEMAQTNMSIEDAMERLEQRLEDNPNDIEGLLLLGRSYASRDNLARASDLILRAADLTGDIYIKGEYAEVLMMESNSTVIPEALEIFQALKTFDPYEPKSRFYIGLAAAQSGDMRGALQHWMDLVVVSPSDAAWLGIVQEQIDLAIENSGIDPSTITPSDSALKLAKAVPTGPTQEQVQEAQEMSAEEQTEMIRSMVQRLADKLNANPNDKEGWLRLEQAYNVLGETDKAAKARSKADDL